MIDIFSGNSHLVKIAKQSIIDDFLQHNNSLALEELFFDKESPVMTDELLTIVSTNSLFHAHKLVIFNRLSQILDIKSSQDAKDYQTVLNSVIDSVHLVIIEPDLDQRSAWANFFKKQTNYKHFRAYIGVKLQQWLCDQAQTYGSNISQSVANYLIQRTGEDIIALDSELRKLSAYNQISTELIDELVVDTSSSQIFGLIDALFAQQYNKAFDLYQQQVSQNNQPLQILGSIIWQIQVIAIVKADSNSLDKISKIYGIHKFPLQKSKALASHIDWQYLNHLVDLCREADHRIKCDFIKPEQALLHLITKICNPKTMKTE